MSITKNEDGTIQVNYNDGGYSKDTQVIMVNLLYAIWQELINLQDDLLDIRHEISIS